MARLRTHACSNKNSNNIRSMNGDLSKLKKRGLQVVGEVVKDFLIGNKRVGIDPMPYQEADLELVLFDEEATRNLARAFASELLPGDVYYLKGSVGVGKSVFSREFIRAVYDEDDLTVTSPTFNLVNVYDDLVDETPIHHYDLYRVDTLEEMIRLNLMYTLPNVVSLIEWPDKIDKREAPEERIELHFFSLTPEEYREYAGEDERIKFSMNQSDDSDPYEDNRPRIVKIYGIGQQFKERLLRVAEDFKTKVDK
eukprot:CAMPEP_0114496024 /NCGR_PEP_ID=MMETSP0109-20121206/5544_1 /TAXON_ID=29199 /ORGANISM="Chlorarachnion reptans, Strain CCCM449" /LENGTH=252 /DNA_ID=CAMNT_0001673259 /DNA_START=309 /DNA_END=1067 /DNA_ORIENTATION=-